MRVVLDTVIYNRAVENPVFELLLRRACNIGLIELVTTHVQKDQLSKTQDPQKREALLSIFMDTCSQQTPTAAFVWDVSNWDQAEWPDEDATSFFEQTLGRTVPGHKGHSTDALLAVTAFAKADMFVTDDRKLFKRTQAAVTATSGKLRVSFYEDFVNALETPEGVDHEWNKL